MAENTVKEMATNIGKLDKFEGHDFRRWQKKMHILWTTLKVVYVLTTPMPELLEDATVEAIRIRAKWENDDYICRGHILNGMSDSLFDVYTNVESAKELPIMEQYNELLRILRQYTQHGLKMDESISVSSIIDKLPPSWKVFKHTLKHGKDDLSLIQLGSHFRIEESLRAQDSNKDKGKEVGGPCVNMTEEGAFHVQVDAIAWWIDSSAITRVCKDRCWFKTYEPVEDGSVLYMGDDHFAPVHGKGSMALEFSSRKTITLFKKLNCNKNDLIKTLRTDRGGEYYDPVFFQSVRVIHETTAPYIPQQNGVAERKNRALKEMVNSMLSYSGLIWGCRAVVRLPDPKRKTFGEKGIDCIFVGYAEHSKAYRFYIIEPNDSISINSIIELRDAIFDENHFSSIPRPKDIPNLDESQRNDHSDDVPNEIHEPRKGKRVRKAKSYGFDFQLYLGEGSRDQVGLQYSYWYSIEEDPRTYNEAMQSRDSGFWKKAIDDKIVDKFKARLVIQGFRQKVGIDYFDTYAPVTRITTIRLLLALAAIHNLVIHQMDIKTTFLNGDLDEEVYMKQLEGFIMPVDKTKKFFSSRFSMKDIGEANIILGIKIKHENKGIVITQSHYIEKILKRFNREDCSPMSTPMDPVEKLNPNTGKPVDQLEYSRAIGCLMYAITSTRPDIAYDVGRLSRFTSNPSRQHWKAITRIFKYLRGTKNYGLSYVGYPLDASWINHVEDSSSTSGWVFLLEGGAISWASKKQTCITGSTIESEFVALAAAGKEAEWLRNLIHEIPIWPKPIAPISIRCDSAPTMARAYSQIYNGKSRHLGVRHGMVRELIRNGARTKRTTYVNMKFCRFKKLGLGFVYVH
nr:zinc finger, CCHC-type [Tanacetum cinerariifolium]